MTIFYVDANRADDTGDGLTKATAKKTLQAGVDLITALGADVLRINSNAPQVLSGVVTFPAITPSPTTPYRLEGWNFTTDVLAQADIDANAGAYSIFASIPAEGLFRYLKMHNNTGANNLFNSSASSRVCLHKCLITNSAAAGLVFGPHSLILECEASNCVTGMLNSTTTTAVLYGCLVHSCTGNLISMGAERSSIIGCRLRNGDGHAISVSQNRVNILFNSLVGKSVAGDDGINYSAGFNEGVTFGNIIKDFDVGIEYNTTGGSMLSGANVFHNNTANEANKPAGIISILPDITADPQFADLANNDFSIGNLTLREQLLAIGMHYGASQVGSPSGGGAGNRIQRGIFLGQ